MQHHYFGNAAEGFLGAGTGTTSSIIRSSPVMRVLVLIGIFLAGAGAWYWKHLQIQDQRGLAHYVSPDYAVYLLLGFSIILTGSVMYVAWREMFPGKRKTKDSGQAAGGTEQKPQEPKS